MSKVPYTINVNEYICSELETIRKMINTHDFSMLPAIVERIQFHASSMEQALYRYDGIRYTIRNLLKEDSDLTDAEFRKKVKNIMKDVKDIDDE
jgi:hypothetical protein